MRLLVIGMTALLAACGGAQAERVQLSGKSEQRPVQVGAFDSVELKGPDRVVVRVGGAQSVTIAGDSAVLAEMDVAVERGQLIVKRRGRMFNIRGDNERATVTVTVPQLASAAVAGSGEMTVDRVAGGNFEAAVGGSGKLRIGQAQAARLDAAVGGSGALSFDQVQADSVEMAVGGSGSIEAAGRTRSVEAAIGGSGKIRAARLESENADISVGGSGTADVHARGLAKVAIAGSGDAVVHGGARCETSKVGSGTVRCGG